MKRMKLKWKQTLPNFVYVKVPISYSIIFMFCCGLSLGVDRSNQPMAVIIRFFFLMLLFLSLLCGSSVTASDKEASENQQPFSPGEQLVYQIRWEAIEAGVAFFNVQPVTKVGEQPCRHFSLKVETSPLVDVFYKIRDQLDSYTDLDLNRSVRYSKKETGSEQRDILVQFDWEKGIARYSNFNSPREPVNDSFRHI